MAPEIDQTVFSWSNFLFKLSGRQVPKQFVRSFHVGLPPAEGGVDERSLCGHSFTRLSFARIAFPQSILFLPLLRKVSSGVPTWRFIAKGRCSIAGSPCSRRIVRKTQVRLLCPLLKDRSEKRTPLQPRRDARKASRRPTWRREGAARSRLRTICQMQLRS